MATSGVVVSPCINHNRFILPTLNSASAAWDPYLTRDVDQLEKVQRRGAKYVENNYHGRSPGCVTNMFIDRSTCSGSRLKNRGEHTD